METLTHPWHHVQHVRNDIDAAAARHAAQALCEGNGLANLAPKVNLVVAELACNLIKHATAGGRLLFRPCLGAEGALEIISVDEGPDINEISRVGGGLGQGLASVQRQSSVYDMYSDKGTTVVLARVGSELPFPAGPLHIGGISVPRHGMAECGDAWACAWDEERLAILLVDGLGHGPHAAAAADAAVKTFTACPLEPPAAWLRQAHDALSHTRGAAVAVAQLAPSAGALEFGGIGNILARMFSGTGSPEATTSLISRMGIVGGGLPASNAHVVRNSWAAGAVLVLASDGLKSDWRHVLSADLLAHHPTTIAAALWQSKARDSDDATAVVIKDKRPVA